MTSEFNGLEIAIVGLSGRFAKSANVEEFWQRLLDGKELISVFTETEERQKKSVKAGSILENVEWFDASFFGFSPREAELMDPQHRLFLECAWEALENAGYDSKRETRPIGVYAGVGMGYYFYNNLVPNPDLLNSFGDLQRLIGADKDYVPTRVSYNLDLKGPSICIGTASSSSLVAVHLACQSLLAGECYMCLAAGISVKIPQNELTLYPDEISSPDGHCRAFDANANGTLGGNGLGTVVLKRLEDAIADRDYIYGIIKGSAINNDGAGKIGYTAPSEEGQTRTIRTAQMVAEVHPESISYLEAHGTGTPLGDPIEIAALTRAFRTKTEKTNYCAIGSVKTNIGHLDAAAGIAGLIKTALSLDRQVIPPSINFSQPNPRIDFANSPFYVNNKLREWTRNGTPRRAGISSFGIGGTNAHAILEEAPSRSPASASRRWQLLLLSAKTQTALETATQNLGYFLKENSHRELADIAYTLQVGRREFSHRRAVVVENKETAIATLTNSSEMMAGVPLHDNPPVVFLFPGQGSQYINMAREVYESEPLFRQECDRCFEILQRHIDTDLHQILYPSQECREKATDTLKQTAIAQPVLFTIEYALARLWMAWGVRPKALLGHSIGEYVAACLAGVFSLEDALAIVALRGRLMQDCPGGAMLSVELGAREVETYLGGDLTLAVSNSPGLSVVSGPYEAIEALKNRLNELGVACRPLHTSHAFHSPLMERAIAPLVQHLKGVTLHPPQIPVISNVTGVQLTPEQATDPQYWGQHLRQTVRFSEGVGELLPDKTSVFLEVGPGKTASTFVKQQGSERVTITSVPHPKDPISSGKCLLNALGRLWLAGVEINWSGFYQDEQRDRIPLPTYPFERERYWVDPPASSPQPQSTAKPKKPAKQGQPREWLYAPQWQLAPLERVSENDAKLARVLVFSHRCDLGEHLVQQLQNQGKTAIVVDISDRFIQWGEKGYCIDPSSEQDYEALFADLRDRDLLPTSLVHLWTIDPQGYPQKGLEEITRVQDLGFFSLLEIARAAGKQKLSQPLHITVVTNNMQPVTPKAIVHPERSTLLGAVKVIPLEYPKLTCRSIDLDISALDNYENTAAQLLVELTASDPVCAYREKERWLQTFAPVSLEQQTPSPKIKEGGAYLITGGLGGIGLVLARYFAKTAKAKLLLIGRSALPPKSEWETWQGDEEIAEKISAIQELESLGSEVVLASADVCDREAMERAIAEFCQKFGALNGIVHAAGVPGGGVIQRKIRETAQEVLAPKLWGTLVLDAIAKDMPLDFFVLCSSLVSIKGVFGQVDYVAANAFLDAFAHYKTTADGTFTVAINWDAWREVGMAARADRDSLQKSSTSASTLTPAHPLFSNYSRDEGQIVYRSLLSPEKHWILDEHRIQGRGTVPGTAYLEMALTAGLNALGGHGVIEMTEVYFPTPLMVEDGRQQEVHTILQPKDDEFQFKIVAPDNLELEGARGRISEGKMLPQQLNLQTLKTEINGQIINFSEGSYNPSRDLIKFGKRWYNLLSIEWTESAGLATLELPEKLKSDVESFHLHPALLDIAVHSLFGQIETDNLYLPFCYKQLIYRGRLTRQIYSYTRLRERTPDVFKFDVTIFSDSGEELIIIKDYTLRKFYANRSH